MIILSQPSIAFRPAPSRSAQLRHDASLSVEFCHVPTVLPTVLGTVSNLGGHSLARVIVAIGYKLMSDERGVYHITVEARDPLLWELALTEACCLREAVLPFSASVPHKVAP